MTHGQQLLDAARDAASRAYAPYSNFPVGAAVLTGDGRIVTGCNVENASFGLTLCAERTAATAVVATAAPAMDTASGPAKPRIVACAIVGLKAAPCHPCGACRQVLHEFGCQTVIVEDPATGAPAEIAFSDLLPHAFVPDDL